MPTPYPKPESRPKKLPQPLKRTPLKKTQAKIRKFTPQRAKLEREKIEMYRNLVDNRPRCCAGCGSPYFQHSHRIPQGDRRFIADPENIDYFCQDQCHVLYENGYLWQLDNGQEIMIWLRNAETQFYRQKAFQMRDRIDDNKLNVSDLPGWVQEILKEIAFE